MEWKQKPTHATRVSGFHEDIYKVSARLLAVPCWEHIRCKLISSCKFNRVLVSISNHISTNCCAKNAHAQLICFFFHYANCKFFWITMAIVWKCLLPWSDYLVRVSRTGSSIGPTGQWHVSILIESFRSPPFPVRGSSTELYSLPCFPSRPRQPEHSTPTQTLAAALSSPGDPRQAGLVQAVGATLIPAAAGWGRQRSGSVAPDLGSARCRGPGPTRSSSPPPSPASWTVSYWDPLAAVSLSLRGCWYWPLWAVTEAMRLDLIFIGFVDPMGLVSVLYSPRF